MNLSKRLLCLLSLWFCQAVQAQTSTLAVIEENGARSMRLNVVFISEGYTSTEMGTFASDVQSAVNFLFTKEPWVRYRSYCNIYRIEIASNQSGTDNGSDGGLRDTYFQSGFNTPGISQLNTVTSTGSSRAFSLLNKHVPEYDVPIIIVNDSNYGGSGGPVAVATTNSYSAQVLEHELGHSLAKLTDEYDFEYAGYPAVEFPNATAKTKRSEIRWNVWIDAATPLPTPEYEGIDPYDYFDAVGLFEGANYRIRGWYRPHENALMRNLGQKPGAVTREAFVLSYYERVGLIDAYTPLAKAQTITSKVPLAFGVTPKIPSTGPALSVTWKIDGVIQTAETGTAFNIPSMNIGNGTHTVTAVVRDVTEWVRRDPTNLVDEEVIWTLKLSNQIDAPVITTPFPTSRVLALGDRLDLDATATGPGPISYQWLMNGKPLVPNVTTPTFSLPPVTLTHAATYMVKITNPGASINHSIVVAVVNPAVNRVVVGKGRTATLGFIASANLPPVTWTHGGVIANSTHYAGATTKSLMVKMVDLPDAGDYFWSAGDFTTTQPVNLLVVNAKPDYTGMSLTLPEGIIGMSYDALIPVPAEVLQTPNSFTGALPAGLKMDAKTGRITGIPTKASKDQINGDEITLVIGNEFGSGPVKPRLRIKPLPSGIEGIFNGPVPRGSELGGLLGGRIDLAILATGSYSGKLTLGAESLLINGVLTVASTSATSATGRFLIKPKAGPPAGIMVAFQVNDGGDADPATASIEGGKEGSAISFTAWRNKWLAIVPGDPFVGYYTHGFALSGADELNPAIPHGTSHGSFTITADGKLTLTIKMSDGEVVNTASHVGPDGQILVYQLLYTTLLKGSVQGVMNIQSGGDTRLTGTGTVSWMRPENRAVANRLYDDGFGPILLNVIGGRYRVPDKTELVMGLDPASGSPLKNARLTFDQLLGADPLAVNADVDVEVKIGGITKIATSPNPKAVSLSITPATGAFKGRYTTLDNDPRSTAATPPKLTRIVDFQGFIMNDEGTLHGRGYFLRDALPTVPPATTPATSPRHSGGVQLNR